MNSHSETDKKQVNSTRNSEKETHPLNELCTDVNNNV